MPQKGFVHIYCGDGKGKTTAAVGLIIRALGAGKRALLVRFLKDSSSSELAILAELPGVSIFPDPEHINFSWNMTLDEKAAYRDMALEKFDYAAENAERFDLIVFDEACSAISLGFLDEARVLDFIYSLAEGQELVFTGREPSEALISAADYVSEIRKVKHPFDKGIAARDGIEQ